MLEVSSDGTPHASDGSHGMRCTSGGSTGHVQGGDGPCCVDEKGEHHGHVRRWNGRFLSCCYPVSTCLHFTCPCLHGTVVSCNWVVGCLCLCSLLSMFYCITSFLCAQERPCFKIGTEHECGTSVRQILAARWMGKRGTGTSE